VTSSILSGFEIPYKLYRRFEALIESMYALTSIIQQLGFVRFKPLFNSYDSCVKEFKNHYLEDYKQLNLEDLPLYDERGIENFTQDKLSTMLHQAQAIVGVLKGVLPPHLLESPGGTSIVVSAQSSSQSAAQSIANINLTLVIDSIGQAIQEATVDDKIKKDLLAELAELKSLPKPTAPKIKSIASKLGSKLYEAGVDIASDVISKLLLAQMGFPPS